MKEYKSSISEFQLKRIPSDIKKAKISSSNNAAEYCRQFFFDDLTAFESFFMVMLNNANNTIGYVKISQGGITGTLVDVRIVAKYAVESLCVGIILCHNHPSGSLTPSQSDIHLTKKIKEALGTFDVKVIDHIILTEESYFSFVDENLL